MKNSAILTRIQIPIVKYPITLNYINSQLKSSLLTAMREQTLQYLHNITFLSYHRRKLFSNYSNDNGMNLSLMYSSVQKFTKLNISYRLENYAAAKVK